MRVEGEAEDETQWMMGACSSLMEWPLQEDVAERLLERAFNIAQTLAIKCGAKNVADNMFRLHKPWGAHEKTTSARRSAGGGAAPVTPAVSTLTRVLTHCLWRRAADTLPEEPCQWLLAPPALAHAEAAGRGGWGGGSAERLCVRGYLAHIIAIGA